MPSAERSDIMNPVDYGILAVILAIAGGAVFAVVKAKKSGKKCIGCPHSGSCGGNCSGCQSVKKAANRQNKDH